MSCFPLQSSFVRETFQMNLKAEVMMFTTSFPLPPSFPFPSLDLKEMLCWVFFFAKCLPFIYQYQIFLCVSVCACACVQRFFSITLFFFPPFLLLFSWAVVWVNLAWGGMYIIKTGLGFVGCQSINQSEFNYQACDGKRWQAPGLLDSISYGAAATKNKKLESMCAWVDAGWEGGGEIEGSGAHLE